ncbi:MAG: uroporphyrinogen-III C-methyltransferase [Planctomycetaceae bacterium]
MTNLPPSSKTPSTTKNGVVYLVGAGPGDPGLLTLRGRECLQMADLVLYDGLANPQLLEHTRATTERTARVGGPGSRHLDQSEINQRLIAAAKEGKTVVRLKGGDPFIFGRGSEEAVALAQAGVPFEVVPGITAATGAAVYSGISLTHRDHASAVALITGHEDPTKPESALPYSQLSHFPGTLVFYMGLHRIEQITRSLVEAGRPSDQPAAVVCQATTPRQQVVVGTLATIATLAQVAHLKPPSLLIVGECVGLRQQASWAERRPLQSLRIGITRPAGQAEESIRLARQLGAEPILMPTIAVAPLTDHSAVDATIGELSSYNWAVFTSVNGVDGFFGRLHALGLDGRALGKCRIAAIGTTTAERLSHWHMNADLIPDEFRAEALAAALQPHVAGKKVLWAKATRGRDVLPQQLSAAGAEVTELPVYQNLDVTEFTPQVQELLRNGELDWICISSPSGAKSLNHLVPDAARPLIGQSIRIAAISPLTASAATEVGLPVSAIAPEATWDSLFEVITANSKR